MAEADFTYRKYTSYEEGKENDFNLFKALDKIGLINTDADDDDDGEPNDAHGPALKTLNDSSTGIIIKSIAEDH